MADYGRGLYRQLTEETEKAERLEGENRELRSENIALRKKVKSLEERMDTLTADLDARIEAAMGKAIKPLHEEIARKDEQLEKAHDEIDRLKASLNKDSGNSSKPPSSNGFRKIPNNREPSERKTGGQPGHKGSTLTIPKNLDELVKEGKARHVILEEMKDAKRYVSDWEIDLKIVPLYTERRRAPGAPPTVRYGADMKSLSVYLQNVGLMSLERLADFFRDVTDGLIAPSEATLVEWSQTAASHIDLEPLITDLLNGPVIHVDDTTARTTERNALGQAMPERAERTSFNACIRTYANDRTTVLTVNAHKDEAGLKHDDILTRFFGILSHDHEAKFYHYGTKHATCGAHLSRELKGMKDLCMLPWAGQVRAFFQEMNEHKTADQEQKKEACDPLALAQYEARYDELVAQGAQLLTQMRSNELGYEELNRMVNRLTDYKDTYLLFIRHYPAPFTNNQSERDLRHCKTKQKVSGCFRSWAGLLGYCIIRSLIDTTRKRGGHVLAGLRDCFLSAASG